MSRVLSPTRPTGAGNERVALVVVDGMSIDQWFILRDALTDQLPDVVTTTTATFAWAPTLTSVSRQALFSGEVPQYFPGSILSTAKEASLWSAFWTSHGLAADQVGFDKGLGEEAGEQKLAALLARPKTRSLGLVVNAVDNIMHGATLGTAGVHGQVRQWAKQGHFSDMLGAHGRGLPRLHHCRSRQRRGSWHRQPSERRSPTCAANVCACTRT